MPYNSNRANSMGAGIDMEAGVIGIVLALTIGAAFYLTIAVLEVTLALLTWLAEKALRPS
jgi:hypothetical protein